MIPRSLTGRVALILFAGLIVAHGLAFWLILGAQGETALTMMLNYLPKDIASSVAILERIPAVERAEWLPRLERRNYHYALSIAPPSVPVTSNRTATVVAAIGTALGPSYVVTAGVPDDAALAVELRLHDGSPLTITLTPPPLAVSPWVAAVLLSQLVVIGVLTWLAVRMATRPLSTFAAAADALGPDFAGSPLREDGPREVAHVAFAFNAMQRRIQEHLAERLQMLAAVSHDLQTPLTRLGLRADLIDDANLRGKLHQDLHAMQALVEQGLAYARSAHGSEEAPRRIDLTALLDSLVCDYTDAGRPVRLDGCWTTPVQTRPDTLRRIVTNLVDNALAFGTDVTIAVEAEPPDQVAIVVRDRGPGIPQSQLLAVLQPFYRLDGSRSRDTGGSGLGLAIAHQLARALGGRLSLANRDGGGLCARVSLPA